MAQKRMALPSKRNAFIFTAVFLFTQFFFLVTVLGNFPILNDTFDVSGYPRFAKFFNEKFIFVDMACTAIQLILFVFICRSFSLKGYPSLITFIFFFYNIITCTVYSLWIYFEDQRKMSFEYQLVFLIPIVVIFMSSVFIIDDYADLLRGNFEAYVSRTTRAAQKKFKQQRDRVSDTIRRGPAEEVEDTYQILTIEETLQQHQEKIANAALKTIPDLDNNEITNYDYLKDNK